MGVDLDGELCRDKVKGCWLGKNCGGTLGGPLEEGYGREEPFDVWWYPELKEGGAPNDDLEMQLIWLKALEEVGPGLCAADLAQYWLDCVGYNWDEYGLSKTNLRLGLRPPASGAYNNWFVDCMGCPIRSEIWACIAPGAPRVAVRYAYQDAICDHAGGESVYGEFFNTAIESAAFVESDPQRLLDIGRSYVPGGSRTAEAIDAARAAFAEGLTWQQARARVLEATPHYVAQYSPINMGFQVIGLLWGEDFGDALCKTVNCGYDTDCTGATLGSILGIIHGASALPVKWTKPLGEQITTSESFDGIINVSDVPNPIPTDVNELTERVVQVARRVMAGEESGGLIADESVRDMWNRPVMRVNLRGDTIKVEVDYGEDPVVVPGEERTVTAVLHNPHPEPLNASCRLRAPEGWQIEPARAEAEVPSRGEAPLIWRVTPPGADRLANSNRLTLACAVEGRPAPADTPVVLIGARRYRMSGPYPAEGKALEQALPPESGRGAERGGDWRVAHGRDNAVPLGDLEGGGVLYVQCYLRADSARKVAIGASATCATRMWVNGELVVDCPEGRRLRPSYVGDGHSYADVEFKQGWNEVLLKYVQPAGQGAPEGHLVFSYGKDTLWDGAYDLRWTYLPLGRK